MTGIRSSWYSFILPLDVWYGALSSRITVSFRQVARCLSRILTSLMKKTLKTVAFVLHYVREQYTLPSVSIPRIIEMRGAT